MLHGGFRNEFSDWIYSNRHCTESNPEIRIAFRLPGSWEKISVVIKCCYKQGSRDGDGRLGTEANAGRWRTRDGSFSSDTSASRTEADQGPIKYRPKRTEADEGRTFSVRLKDGGGPRTDKISSKEDGGGRRTNPFRPLQGRRRTKDR